jgi:hypothetical protein
MCSKSLVGKWKKVEKFGEGPTSGFAAEAILNVDEVMCIAAL